MKEQKIKDILQLIGFRSESENCNVWKKYYNKHDCYIEVDFSCEKISYPKSKGMILGDLTTSNLINEENFVVLECVDRLLCRGYPPNKIELEKKWTLGHNTKGKLDILVKQRNNENVYLMVECKTSSEYMGEVEKMLKNGGQLFSYWQQDRSAEFLCLYTSMPSNNTIKYQNSLVRIENEFREAGDVTEVFDRWNKQFNYKGVFEDNVNAYGIKFNPLIKKDLNPLKEDDGKRIYNQFLEILRHNIVSDKGNAFNKIFNLFLCKIFDEDRHEDEELEFQWIEGRDNEEVLLGRLNSLYKQGMLKYLDKDITDYSIDDIESVRDNEEIRKIIKELRLYKNQEFAFVDVFNRESFFENAGIVIEIVKLLQGWQIRYTHKQQFLGEFFELLLNTGFKQESGQFFTPVPLVRFILRSLPINSIIQQKIKDRQDNFLPYLIDFACGSGHFLTEAMDIFLEYIKQIETNSGDLTPAQQNKLRGYCAEEFGWAKEYIYGIELDYRLAKTSKLASFLNGDGEARIFHASGIAPFSSNSYSNLLSGETLYNEKFDVLVANPPYAVKGFKSTVEDGNSSFTLYEKLSDKSGDIEVLFIERITQLVCSGGVVGVILPRSMLNGRGIYEDARKIIFENFELKAIVILGSNAFMATGINTTVFFLKKRQKPVKLNTLKDYRKICKGTKIVVAKSDKEKDSEKRFLGYEFSSRKGSEGIKNRENSLLVDENNIDSDSHVNSYILLSMEDRLPESINPLLEKYIAISPLEDLFDWHTEPFSNGLVFTETYQLRYRDETKIVSFKSVIETIESGKRPVGGVSERENGVGSLGGEHIDEEKGIIKTNKMKFVSHEFYSQMSRGKVQSGDILICKDGARTGKCAYFDSEKQNNSDCNRYCINEHLFLVRAKNVCDQKYLFYFMMSSFFLRQVGIYAYNKKAQPGLNLKHIEKIQILLPSLKEQKDIVSEIEKDWDNLTETLSRKHIIDNVFSSIGLKGDHNEQKKE